MTALAYVEHCLPGAGVRERRELARRLGVDLELASRPGLDLGALRRDGQTVVSLQAHGMHDGHPLHPDPARRAAGLAHLLETIAAAAALGVPRVVSVCGYGHEVVTRPLESCLAFFQEVAPFARERGVRVLIEPLSPLRSSAMTAPGEVEALLEALAAPDVFGAVLDTGHLLDAERGIEDVLARWPTRVDELQLRGRSSSAPAPDVPLAAWIGLLPEPPDVVAIEHGRPLGEEDVHVLVEALRASLARV